VWDTTKDYYCNEWGTGGGAWWSAPDYNGHIFYSSVGQFDVVAYGGSWFWCDIDNDGESPSPTGQGIKMTATQNNPLTSGGHQFICFKGGVYESIAECCGASLSSCISGGDGGVRYKDGDTVSMGGKTYWCTSSATWSTTPPAPPSADIGLKAYDGTGIITIAVEPAGTVTSPLRIAKGGTIYGIMLVDPSDSSASKLRIQTSSGVKALKKFS
jgi:hypothetical protein